MIDPNLNQTLSTTLRQIGAEFAAKLRDWHERLAELDALATRLFQTDFDYRQLTDPDQCVVWADRVLALQREWEQIARDLPWQALKLTDNTVDPTRELFFLERYLRSELPLKLEQAAELERRLPELQAQAEQHLKDAEIIAQMERLGFRRRQGDALFGGGL